jgi:2-polyprenyl-6-methoxyphenol hydroxylase-like FAD-dependent oxidoreductase
MQAPWVVLFRPDLHEELQRLAFEIDGRTIVPELKLGAKIVSVVCCIFGRPKQRSINRPKDIESATITLEDGMKYTADLVVGADGENVCYVC